MEVKVVKVVVLIPQEASAAAVAALGMDGEPAVAAVADTPVVEEAIVLLIILMAVVAEVLLTQEQIKIMNLELERVMEWLLFLMNFYVILKNSILI